MGSFGSHPGSWSTWVWSGLNTWNSIHQGSNWTAPGLGRFTILYAYMAGHTGAVLTADAAWDATSLNLAVQSLTYSATQGSGSTGGQTWRAPGISGNHWIGGPFQSVYQFGWGRDSAVDHEFSTVADGGAYYGDQGSGVYVPGSIASSTSAPLGSNGSVGAYADMQDLQSYVKRGGGWQQAFMYPRRSGAWGLDLNGLRRSGTWSPLAQAIQLHRDADGWQSLYARMLDKQDIFFGLKAGADMRIEDRACRVWDGREWLPGLLRMTPDGISSFGTDRVKFDRAMDEARKMAYLAAAA